MKTNKKIEKLLDILNDVSCFLEEHVMCEEDKDRIIQLDRVINFIYNLTKGK